MSNDGSGMTRVAGFIGIGGQKCASSWIYRILEDHPQVAVGEPKELDFFSYYYDRGSQWYERHFALGPGVLTAGEVSPSYLLHPDAPARAHAYNPGLRIVVALRDPVGRAWSNHLHEVRLGHFAGEDISFEAGLRNNPMYLEQSLYAKHLARWFATFGRDSIHVTFQEDIERDPAGEAVRLYRFLGVAEDHVAQFLDRRANESYVPRNALLERITRALGRAGRALGLGALVRAVRYSPLVDRYIGRNRVHLREVVPPMREETRARLRAFFADDEQALAQLLGMARLPWQRPRDGGTA